MNFSTNYLGGQLDRALVKSLPCLPGFNFDLNIGADRFNRAGHFTFNKGINILADQGGPRHKPGIGGLTPPPWAPIRTGPDHTVYPTHHGSKVPTWIAYDKQVLCFDAYYQEPIPESELETYRIHQCKIYYFLEDDTIQVMEPKTHNAGLPQGQIIRRHRIPLPEPCKDSFYTVEHFNVGCEVLLYGKSFKICACDAFTRKFLNRLGIAVPHNTEMPCDPGTEKMKDRKVAQFSRKPYHTVDTRGPFLQHSDHVLRFWGYWDDRCKMYGDLRQFVIHYFLTDHTLEIREILQPNSGYESFPLFLRRSKVPKTPENLVGIPGENTPLTILNVFGSIYGTKSKRPHYMVDNLGNKVESDEYYRDNDLAIGAVLNIYGRPFILTDCDEFTKQYYRDKYQVEDFTPLELNEQLEMEIPEPTLPPYHGWGQEDDLGSCKSLEMKIAVKDYRKETKLEKDILRFESKFYKALQHVNDSRRFVINYYMADDTIQVFEKEHPNSGLPKGNFLVRSKVKKPGHQPHIGEEPKYYSTKDMFVGNTLDINGFSFQLLNADEFTYSYMEANKHLFPHANICLCLDKVREAFGPLQSEEVLKCFAENDTCLQGVMDLRNFRSLLLQVTKCGLSEHELLTISRAFAAKTPPPGVDFLTLQAICQTELRRFHFDRILLARVEYTFRYHDPCRSGRVDRETLRATLKGAKLPLFRDLLNFLVDKFPSPEGDLCNRVDYCDLLRFLNWEDNPAPIAKPAAIQCVMKWVEPQPPMKIMCVNYRAFLEDVCPNLKCALPAVCCCCNDNRPCPQHPDKQQETNYCGEPNSTETQIEPCQPLEPVTVFMKPCSITYTEGNTHRCAPGSQKCFLNQQEEAQNQGGSGNDGGCGTGGGCGGGGCGGGGGGCGSGGCS